MNYNRSPCDVGCGHVKNVFQSPRSSGNFLEKANERLKGHTNMNSKFIHYRIECQWNNDFLDIDHKIFISQFLTLYLSHLVIDLIIDVSVKIQCFNGTYNASMKFMQYSYMSSILHRYLFILQTNKVMW